MDGTPTGRKIVGVKPGGIAISLKGVLAVADTGARHQIILFNINKNQAPEMGTVGERGGVFGARGIMSDYRLLNPNGVAFDAAGDISVSGGWRILNFAPDGKLRWKVVCTHFVNVGDFDPTTDGNDLYTKNFPYRHMPGAQPGKDWQWVGYLADSTRFPMGAEGAAQTFMRRLNNTLYRFVPGNPFQVSRKEVGTTFFVPVAAVQMKENPGVESRPKTAPEKGRYIWMDKNGDGLHQKEEFSVPSSTPPFAWSSSFFIDSAGGPWEPQGRKGMRYIPLTSINSQGVPVYDWGQEKYFNRPAEFMEVRRAYYYPESDTMYLSGYTWENPEVPGEQWTTSGTEIIRYDNWSKQDRRMICRIPFINSTCISSFDIVPQKNLLFAGDLASSAIFVYDTLSGKLLGMIEPDPDLIGFTYGWLDHPGGAIHAMLRQSGEIIISLEECVRE